MSLPSAATHEPAQERARGSESAFYLALDPDPLFVTAHRPAPSAHRGVGVLVCPAFGWDEMYAHRSMYVLAKQCADAGFPALRFDLPGTGDSGGSPRDPDRVQAWTAATGTAARYLREHEGCERVVAFGIGLGGLIAARALAAGAPIDDLALWSVVPRGSLLLREMRALERFVKEEVNRVELPGDSAPEPDDESIEVAGFVVAAETVATLESIDLTTAAISSPEGRRVLLLSRDKLPIDRRLREYYERSGVALTVAEGAGFGSMMSDPAIAEIPRATLQLVVEWVTAAPPSAAQPIPSADHVAVADSITLAQGPALIRETPFEFKSEGRLVRGVLCEPVSAAALGVCAVMPNAGGGRRIGVQRIWVEQARSWAALGVSSLRVDMPGIGDSDGEEQRYVLNDFFRHNRAAQLRHAMDALQARGVADRFVFCGLCSGAYYAFEATLVDERVRALLLVNLGAFYWNESLWTARDQRRARDLLERRSLRQLIRLLIIERRRIPRLVRMKLRNLRNIGRGDGQSTDFDARIVSMLDAMRERELAMLLLFGDGEPLYDELRAGSVVGQLDRWPNLHLEHMAVNDHNIRPIRAQRHVAHVLGRELARVLEMLPREPAER